MLPEITPLNRVVKLPLIVTPDGAANWIERLEGTKETLGQAATLFVTHRLTIDNNGPRTPIWCKCR